MNFEIKGIIIFLLLNRLINEFLKRYLWVQLKIFLFENFSIIWKRRPILYLFLLGNYTSGWWYWRKIINYRVNPFIHSVFYLRVYIQIFKLLFILNSKILFFFFIHSDFLFWRIFICFLISWWLFILDLLHLV